MSHNLRVGDLVCLKPVRVDSVDPSNLTFEDDAGAYHDFDEIEAVMARVWNIGDKFQLRNSPPVYTIVDIQDNRALTWMKSPDGGLSGHCFSLESLAYSDVVRL